MSVTELDQLEKQVAEEAVTVEDIRSNLKQTKNGAPRQTIYNCLYVLRRDPVFGGAFRKNFMTGRTVVTKKMSWHREGENYTDDDEDNLKLYLEEKYALKFSEADVEKIIIPKCEGLGTVIKRLYTVKRLDPEVLIRKIKQV